MSADSGSKGAVFAALICNTLLTVIKFVAFAFSGSGSMFSEAMHTLADTANQGLLFMGIKRSEKAPDAMFTYGYGGERFLFALLSAVGIFVLGCGVTVYHGIHSIIDPKPVEIHWWLFAVLGISFVMDGFVLLKAVAAINRTRKGVPFVKFLRSTSDPTIAAVLLEDGIACGGVIVALVGIGLAQVTGNPLFDALGSIAVGGLLGFIAIWLGYKNRSLILGRAIPADVQRRALEFLRSQPSVEAVHEVQSRVLGADQFALKAEIDWNGRWLGQQALPWVAANKDRLLQQGGEARFAAEFGEAIVTALGDEVDRIEKELRQQFPELKYLDFEAD
ncbi:MAG: cation diffusion facilitator family transporter [Planctomycetes bacterium]|nr:cation diffusion facilitator family transporter [Planctomycetota bacterium]